MRRGCLSANAPAVMLALAWSGVAAPTPREADADALTLTRSQRALQPGEVVRLELDSRVPLRDVRASALGRQFTFHRLSTERWWALLGLDVALTPGEHPLDVRAVTISGEVRPVSDVLTIEPKEFPTRTLRVPRKFVSPPRSALPRIRKEGARLAAVYREESDEVLWSGPFVLPIDSAVVSGFGVRSVFNGEPREPHGGVDIAGSVGTPIHAPNAGRVVFTGNLYFTGNTVIIDHGGGLYSFFGHLSRTDVRQGDILARGDLVGAVGATGRVTGPHLHWGVRLHGARVDPRSLISITEAMTP